MPSQTLEFAGNDEGGAQGYGDFGRWPINFLL